MYRKDGNKTIVLFNDGTLRMRWSSDYLLSRFQIDYEENGHARFKNEHGKYLNSKTMLWETAMDVDDQKMIVEFHREFQAFKNSKHLYLTVTDTGLLSFDSKMINNNTIFRSIDSCPKGMLNNFITETLNIK